MRLRRLINNALGTMRSTSSFHLHVALAIFADANPIGPNRIRFGIVRAETISIRNPRQNVTGTRTLLLGIALGLNLQCLKAVTAALSSRDWPVLCLTCTERTVPVYGSMWRSKYP